jgi:hypothetical protein
MRSFSAVVVFLATFLAALPVAAAPVLESPEALIEYAYRPYADGTFPEDPFELYSPSLRALVNEANMRTGEDEVGAIDFDPFIDAQDYDGVAAVIRSTVPSTDAAMGNRADVDVTVTNFGEDAELTFSLVETGNGWLIDDIARVDGDAPWRLSEILADDPALN